MVIGGFLFIGTHVFAATPLSMYKQFGSVAALAETCLQSDKIPVKLNAALAHSGLEQEMINALIEAYNDGYKNTLLSLKLWIADKETWNKKLFNCENEKDKALIQQFENQIYLSL